MLVGKLEGKRPLRRPRCNWEDNIRLDLDEVGWTDVCGLVGPNEDGNEPPVSIKCGELLE
jgi:hypothetical protein